VKKLAYYGAALIAIYLAVDHFSGTSSIIKSASSGGAGFVKSLQGR